MRGQRAAGGYGDLLLEGAAGGQHGGEAAVWSLQLVKHLPSSDQVRPGGASGGPTANAARERHLCASDAAAVQLKLCVLLQPHAVDVVQGPPIHPAALPAQKAQLNRSSGSGLC